MLRRYFIAGLLVWLPLVATVWILEFLVGIIGGWVALLPTDYQPSALLGFSIPGLDILIAVIIILSTGFFVTHLLGHRIVALWEKILARIPLVRSIYGAIKQVVETLFSSSEKSFRQVVLIEYPHAGTWVIAFQTGSNLKEGSEKIGEELVSVFVPTSPNPTAGFLLMLPPHKIVKLEMSVDEALKMVISMGVMVPKQEV